MADSQVRGTIRAEDEGSIAEAKQRNSTELFSFSE